MIEVRPILAMAQEPQHAPCERMDMRNGWSGAQGRAKVHLACNSSPCLRRERMPGPASPACRQPKSQRKNRDCAADWSVAGIM